MISIFADRYLEQHPTEKVSVRECYDRFVKVFGDRMLYCTFSRLIKNAVEEMHDAFVGNKEIHEVAKTRFW